MGHSRRDRINRALAALALAALVVGLMPSMALANAEPKEPLGEPAAGAAPATATAESGDFSYYTVEFTYGDLQYVLQGGEKVPLADILTAVGLVGEVTDVEVSDPDLFSASEEPGGWVVSSHEAFSSSEWMRVAIAGRSYEIAVTDWIYCGDNLTWKLSDAGVLTISGTGAMEDFQSRVAPWYDLRDSIKSVVIEDGATSIGWDAFKNCSNLTSVEIPASVKSIEAMAFGNCELLASVKGMGGVERIGDLAFAPCAKLKDVYYGGSPARWNGIVSAFPDSVTVHYMCGDNLTWALSGTTLTISGTGAMYDYEADYDYPWYESRGNITSIGLPDGITTIGSYAFAGCSIGSIEIPDSVETIGRGAFIQCDSLASVVIPGSVKTIGDSAFEGCDSLASVEVRYGVEAIGENAFLGCDSIHLRDSQFTIAIPSSVTNIKDAFPVKLENGYPKAYFGGTVEQWASVMETGGPAEVVCMPAVSLSASPEGDGDVTGFETCTDYSSSDGAWSYTATAKPKDGRTFVNWTNEAGEEVSQKATDTFSVGNGLSLKANFAKDKYTIAFVNDDGTELQSGEVANGETPEYTGETPTKAATAQHAYTFKGWSPEVVPVTGDATYKATYTETVNEYTVTYKVVNGTWSDGGTTDKKEAVQGGAKPASVPTGMKASPGYAGGAWDKDPAGATIMGATTFTYTFTASPTIAKASISKARVTLAKTSCAYDGKAKRPAVKSVVLDGKTLKAGADYAVKYANNVRLGTATATVTGKDAYKDSAKATFTIALGKAKLTTEAQTAARAMNTRWAKVPGARKYQVQWRERGGKWKSKSVKSLKATVKGMEAGKLYDYRVRAVSGNYKGAWSAQRHRWFERQAGVKASSGKAGAVKVSWSKTAKANAGYLVVVRYSKYGDAVASKIVKAGKTSATVKGLKPGKTAWVQVRALRNAGDTTYNGVLTLSKSSVVRVAGKSGAKAQSTGPQATGDSLMAAER